MNGARESLFPARDIRPGDDIVFLGNPHRVVTVEPYDGPMTKYGCFAVAKGRDGWVISLYESASLEVER
jgi:hypothetical protein